MVWGALVKVMYGASVVLQQFDPTTNTATAVTGQPKETNPDPIDYLNLPNGQVMITVESGSHNWVLTPDRAPQDAWRPTVTSVTYNSSTNKYTLTGTQISGLINGGDEGDDMTMAENYPIIWLKDSSGNVTYCKSSNFSNMMPSKGSRPRRPTSRCRPRSPPARTSFTFRRSASSRRPAFRSPSVRATTTGAAGASGSAGGTTGTGGTPARPARPARVARRAAARTGRAATTGTGGTTTTARAARRPAPVGTGDRHGRTTTTGNRRRSLDRRRDRQRRRQPDRWHDRHGRLLLDGRCDRRRWRNHHRRRRDHGGDRRLERLLVRHGDGRWFEPQRTVRLPGPRPRRRSSPAAARRPAMK